MITGYRFRHVALYGLTLFLTVTAYQVHAETVSVAIFDSASPISYIDRNGEPAGIMPDILTELLPDLGYEPEFVTGLTFHEAYDRVVSGEIDILPAAIYSDERARVLDYNEEPFVVAWGQLGILPGEDFSGLLELRNQRIGMMRDGQNAANFAVLMERFDIPFVPVYFDSFSDITDAIIAGDVAAGVFFSTWFRSATRVVPSSIVFAPTQGLVATAKGTNDDLLTQIDARLGELKKDDQSYYYEVLNHWLAQESPVTLPRWVWIAAIVAGSGLTTTIAFVIILRRKVRDATKALANSRERYKTIADYAHGWEFWSAPDGTFRYVSPNTEEVTGYSAAEFVKDLGLIDRIIIPEDRRIWLAHVDDVQNEDRDVDRGQCTFRIAAADGSVRWIEHRCTRVQSPEGEYLGRRGSNIDITDRVQQAQALERGLREKEVMLKEIHHRVKNNLQMISSMVALQKDMIDDGAVLGQLDAIDARIDAMAALHTTIYHDESFVAVDMQDYIGSIVSRVRALIGSHAPVDCDVEVAAIDMTLSRALTCGLITNEALMNVYKHAFPDGVRGMVRIALHYEVDDHIRLSIRDNGIGMTDGPDSDGIGLRLISVLTEQLGGDMQIVQDEGVSIEIVFPGR